MDIRVSLPSSLYGFSGFWLFVARSLATIGFRDVTEMNGLDLILVTSLRSIWELMAAHLERERGLVSRRRDSLTFGQ